MTPEQQLVESWRPEVRTRRRRRRSKAAAANLTRVRRTQERRAQGRRVYPVEGDEVTIEQVLVAAGLLDPMTDHETADVARAIWRLIELLAHDLP